MKVNDKKLIKCQSRVVVNNGTTLCHGMKIPQDQRLDGWGCNSGTLKLEKALLLFFRNVLVFQKWFSQHFTV